ncbi:MAG: carboxypeptidase regulatory-like domain-containing protein [Bryobacteraceae bacterium]
MPLRNTICALILFCSYAFGQTAQGRISGRVLDPGSAVIPGVEVVATNEATGVATRAHSNEAGIYVLPFLQPGRYTITATATGFKTYERKGIEVATAEVLGLDLALELGNITETVSVTAEAPLLESSSSTIGQFVDSRAVAEMPLAGRRALELVRLAGNVVFINYSNNAKPIFSVAGGRAYQSMYMLDGGNIQNLRIASAQVDIDPPVEVVQEFKVVQNAYAAEYGGSAAGILVSTTKSGSNNFHGSAFEFFRNDAMDAPGFFAPTDGTRKLKAPLRYNLFGGTLGGPIIHNRTHFFAGYEGTRRSDGSTQILTVPTARQRAGDFSETVDSRGRMIPIYDPSTTRMSGNTALRDPFPGNVIPANKIDPVAQAFLKYWPLPNRAGTATGGQNFSGNRSQIFRRDNVTSRVDHALSDKNRLYFRFVYNSDPYRWTSVLPYKEADTTNPFGPIIRWQTSYLISDTHTLTPNLISDVRYSYTNRKFYANSAGLGSDVIEKTGLKGVPGGAFPAISVAGIAGIGASQERKQFPIRQHQFINNWTWVRDKHQVKFGGEVRQSLNMDINRPSITGNYGFATTGTALPGNNSTGYAFASFLSGFADSFSMRETEPLDRYNFYLAGFVQDDWKITRTFTLNLGVRWETDTPIMDRNDRMNSFDPFGINPVSGTPGIVKFVGQNGWPRNPYNADWNNFGPRFGFAWQPTGAWVVRGGYGIFFGGPDIGVNNATGGFEKSGSLSSPDNGVTPALLLRNGVQGVTLSGETRDDKYGAVKVGEKVRTNVDFYQRDRATTYSHQYNLTVQRQLPGSVVVEAAYVANLSRKVPSPNLTLNQVRPELMASGNAQSRRPFPQFNNVNVLSPTIGMNNYHSGMARVEKRLSQGLSFLATYTFARTIGDCSSSNGGDFGDNQQYMDAYNRKLDKGPDALDIIHRFAWSSVYDLPWGKGRKWLNNGIAAQVLGGWTLGSIITMQSGGPFTVTTQTNATNVFSAGANRANVLRNPNLPKGERTLERWFDTSAFVAPPALAFGNAGRGIVRADGRAGFDLSLNKNFTFAESRYVQFRGELFNAFNHPDFAPPNHSLGSSSFGSIADATDPRTIQLGLRILF